MKVLWGSCVRQKARLKEAGLIKVHNDVKLTAELLNKKYGVRGSFYTLEFPGGALSNVVMDSIYLRKILPNGLELIPCRTLSL